MTREDATLQGYASTAEVLQGTAITGGATQTDNSRAGFTVNGGAGVNTIGLRGMSPTRTLVLLNGRRVSPAGTRGSVGAADLNVLPSAMIERVEVLRDGASSVYGSDAVAGVINLQTRKNFEGLSVEATANVPMDADGAGMSSRLSVVGGLRGANWRLSGAADYFERNEMTLRDRDFTLCNRLMQRNPQTGASLDYIDPNTGKAKCFPTNGSGASINLIGTGTRTGVGAPEPWEPSSTAGAQTRPLIPGLSDGKAWAARGSTSTCAIHSTTGC
ncbi:TonB-dependent receptor plug domain-containing protein [Brevundimonas sp. LF-1]|uniref:TonB-dependent receptor plug domain-containing protein n=1 Tax=Brevundimonas sp. LF-1 TaxID=3126100 RepID=UPI0030DEA410